MEDIIARDYMVNEKPGVVRMRKGGSACCGNCTKVSVIVLNDDQDV